MATNERDDRKALALPMDAYGALVDFCLEALRLDDVPSDEDLGLVAAYLLGLGMKAVESAEAPETSTEGFAS